MIKLDYNYGFKWFIKNNTYVKGYIFDENNKLYKDEELVDYFIDVKNQDDFNKKLINANGIFSVIVVYKDLYFIAVDKIRTFPLFYYQSEDEYVITDNTDYLKDKYDLKIDEMSKEEFLSCGYVTEEQTLIKNIFQVQASEQIMIDLINKELEKKFFFTYATNKVFNKKLIDYEKDFAEILDNLTIRLIKSLNNKTAVIPLSGGYDSRLVAVLLKKHNYTNVICFTYGNKSSFEVGISKSIAEELDFKWHFIEYNQDLISGYEKTKEFNEYYKFSFNNASCFLLQDYFAIQYLKKQNLIPCDSIIITGHSGDLLAGSQMPWYIKYKSNTAKINKEIIKQTYIYKKPENLNQLSSKINFNIEDGYSYSIVENYFINRKIARFISNAHRIYEYFGYKHRFPLWDDELAKFFKKLPYEYKREPYFYEESLLRGIFKEYKIDVIPPDKIGRNTLYAKVKRFIKQFTPDFIVNLRIKMMFNDINNVNYMTKPLLDDSKNNVKDITNIYAIISNWLINRK